MADKDKEWTLPAYLTNINSGLDDILLDGKDYLQGLPLRRRLSKRKRPTNDNDVVNQPQSTSLFHQITEYMSSSQFRFGGIYSRDGALVLSVVIIFTGLIIKRLRFIERSEVNKESTRRKKKKKRKKKKAKAKTITGQTECAQTATTNEVGSGMEQRPSCTTTNKDRSNGRQLTEVAIVTPSKIETSKCPENEIITTNPTLHRLSIEMNQEASISATQISNQNEMNIIHVNHNQFNPKAGFPINKIASRWESLGLSRQKSLELAANAELNWYFYQEIKQFVSFTAIHLFDQLGWHSLQILTQSEAHHREQLNAPAFDMLRKCRQEAKFSLLKTQLLCQCLFLALAARFVRHDNNLVSLSNTAISTFLSNICPDCNTPIILDTISNFLYYDLDSWRNFAYNLMESMSSAWYCVGRLIFCTFCLGILHCVSRKMTYALLASTLIPWRDIITTGFVLVMTNCLLTISMLKRSKFDLGLEKTGGDVVKIDPRQATDLYKRQMTTYRAVSYFFAFCIGLFGIDASFAQVIKSLF